MSTNYAEHLREVPQSEAIPGQPMVQNNAGGFVFAVTPWTQLDRFLVLGAEGNTYYATERKMTIANAENVLKCLEQDGKRVVDRIAKISQAGRAPKNDPAIFALALCVAKGNPETKAAACQALSRVCRIPTHLFQFMKMYKALGGKRGRQLRRTLCEWYGDYPSADFLGYHVTKYQEREGWKHRDVLRYAYSAMKARETPVEGLHQRFDNNISDVLYWCVNGWSDVGEDPHPQQHLLPIWAFEKAKRAKSKEEVVRLIQSYNLPRECVPTQFLTEASIWEALLERMPMTAMIRSLSTMTRVGLLAPMSNAVKKVLDELSNSERLAKSRIHPMAVLTALKTYSDGRGVRGSTTWTPVPQIVDALDGAFYMAFSNVESTGKRWLLALDVSGSMDTGVVAGCAGITPRVASAAMSLVTANVESQHAFVAFTSGGWTAPRAGLSQWASDGLGNAITPLSISPRQRVDDVCEQIRELPMGGTDCALPMLYAAEQKIPVDCFVIYTDNETWAGRVHPTVALREYRQKLGIPAKLIVVGLTSTGFTIADPADAGQLDMVGFDAAAPELMSDFVRDEL
jgi:60 kDa SS-A/Ro ribonucleoprotein